MIKLRDAIVELYKNAATAIPSDIEKAISDAVKLYTDKDAKNAFENLLSIIKASRKNATPICKDTGIPIFYVTIPKGISHALITNVIHDATKIATHKIPLSAEAVNPLNTEVSPDNIGKDFPLITIKEADTETFTIDLMLRGGDCEVAGKMFYFNPKDITDLLSTLKDCVTETINHAQGQLCPPYIVTVAVGGARKQVTELSTRLLFKRLDTPEEQGVFSELQAWAMQTFNKINDCKLLGIKAGFAYRHSAVLIVDIAISCWSTRRARLVW